MQENIKKFRGFLFRHIYIFSITVILISLYFLSIADFGYIGFDLILTNLQGRLAISIVLILIMKVLGLTKGCFSKKGIIKGFISGWPLLLIGILYFIILLIDTDWAVYLVGINTFVISAVIFDMFCTGLFEEVLMRGLVFQSMTQKWGNDKIGNMKSMLISSLFFGLMHLLNYSPGLLIATVSQIIFTFFIGMFLCSVFITSGKNLWVVIILHAVFDFITLILQQDFIYHTVSDGPITDMSLIMGIIIVLATLPLGLLSIRNIKRYFG